jgi:hypothetical protein
MFFRQRHLFYNLPIFVTAVHKTWLMKFFELSIIEQVNKAVSEIDKTTQRVSANAEESAASVEELSAQTRELNHMVEELSRFVGLKKI